MKANKLISSLLSAAVMLTTAAPLSPEASAGTAAPAAVRLQSIEYVMKDLEILYGYLHRTVNYNEFSEYAQTAHQCNELELFDYNSSRTIDVMDLVSIFKDLESSGKISYTETALDYLMKYLDRSVRQSSLEEYTETNYFVPASVFYDLNNDGKISQEDAALLREKLIASGYAVTDFPSATTTTRATTVTTTTKPVSVSYAAEDLNCDGKVDMTDFQILYHYATGIEDRYGNNGYYTWKESHPDAVYGDMDGNKRLDIRDVLLFKNYLDSDISFDSYENGFSENGSLYIEFGERGYAHFNVPKGEKVSVPIYLKGTAASFTLSFNINLRELRDVYFEQKNDNISWSFSRDYDRFILACVSDKDTEYYGSSNPGNSCVGYLSFTVQEDIWFYLDSSVSSAVESSGMYLKLDSQNCDIHVEDSMLIETMPPVIQTTVPVTATTAATTTGHTTATKTVTTATAVITETPTTTANYTTTVKTVTTKPAVTTVKTATTKPVFTATMPVSESTNPVVTTIRTATTKPVYTATMPVTEATYPVTTTRRTATTKPAVTTSVIESTKPVTAATETTAQTESPFMRGNLNDDGEVSVEDAQIALNAYARVLAKADLGLTEFQFRAADINGDETISVDDAQLILIYYVKNTLANVPTTWDDLLGVNQPAEKLPFLKRIFAIFKEDE